MYFFANSSAGDKDEFRFDVAREEFVSLHRGLKSPLWLIDLNKNFINFVYLHPEISL